MVDEVNRALPKGQRFPEVPLYAGKTRRLLAQHERLFPASKLRKRYLYFVLVAPVGMAAAFCALRLSKG
jgi:hypothetical protein